MTTKNKWIGIWLLALFCLAACDDDDDVALVNPFFNSLEIAGGSDFEIPVETTEDWYIESVTQTASGESIVDKDNKPLALNGMGKAEAANGWLALTRNEKDRFVINLKENFDPTTLRTLTICINSGGHRDYVNIRQKAGTNFIIKKTAFEEIEDLREIYDSDDECTTFTLSNDSPEKASIPYGSIFENVTSTSTFESDDYGAFDWVPEEGVVINAPELIIDNQAYATPTCIYKEGTTSTRDKSSVSGSAMMDPHSKSLVEGYVTYCKRICNYTFTIENTDTGTQFDVTGRWTGIVPITNHLKFSDATE